MADADIDRASREAKRSDAEADRRLLAHLQSTDDLVIHDQASACTLGFWHTGACET